MGVAGGANAQLTILNVFPWLPEEEEQQQQRISKEDANLLKSAIFFHQWRKDTGAVRRWWLNIVVTKAAE